MRGRDELLGRLKELEASQFEELLFRLSVDLSVLPAATVSRSERAIAAIRRLEQEEDGLGRLARVLDDLDWFKEFVAEGAYPVDERLLQREIGRETSAMEDAAARGEDPEERRVSPEKFYSLRPEAAWLGVYRRWDSPRAFHQDLVDRTLRAADSPATCPAAAIVGPGLSGKSVALRRLGVDLAEQGHRVWWVEEPERLLRFGLSRLADVAEGPQFLLLDEIDYLEERYIRRFQSELARKPHLVLVVAGRSLPPLFRGMLRPGEGLYVPDEAADRADILERIGEIVPEWAAEARTLAGQPLKRERLLRLLLVLARRGTLRHLKEVEAAFLQVLADDIGRIRSVLPGLAEAIIDAAAIKQVGPDISRQTLLAIADHHQPTGAVSTLLVPIDGNPRWSVAEALVSWNPTYDTVPFHHHELADGLVLAGQRGLLGPRVTGDDPWRTAIIEFVVEQGSRRSSSYAVGAFARRRPDLLDGDVAVRHIRRLLAAGNGHHYYLTLLVDEAIVLQDDERQELLRAAAAIAPLDEQLWGTAWAYLRRHCQEHELGTVLERLHKRGARAWPLLVGLLQSVPTPRATALAREWLGNDGTHPHVLAACLNILGQEAKTEARDLLKDNEHPHVLIACLNILGQEAKTEARDLLKKNENPNVLLACLNTLGDDAKEDARTLLKESKDHRVLIACLNILGDDAKEDARTLLKDSKDHRVLVACRDILGEGTKEELRVLLKDSRDPDSICHWLGMLLRENPKEEAKHLLKESQHPIVRVVCRSIISVGDNGEEGTGVVLKNSRHPDLLCRCLRILGENAKEEARALLKESEHHQVLSACLNILGQEATAFAVERIICWTEAPPALLVRCFQVAGATPEAGKAAHDMLTIWDDSVPSILRVAALRAPFDTPLRVLRAEQVLEGWHRHYRPLVAAALAAFWDDADSVVGYCEEILARWHPETLYRHKKRLREYDGHIIKALSHPSLRQEAHQAAEDMLRLESRSPGFLGVHLREQAERISHGDWPPWSGPANETISDSG